MAKKFPGVLSREFFSSNRKALVADTLRAFVLPYGIISSADTAYSTHYKP